MSLNWVRKSVKKVSQRINLDRLANGVKSNDLNWLLDRVKNKELIKNGST